MNSTPDISPLLPDEDTVRARREVLTDVAADSRRGRRGPIRARRVLVAVAILLALGGSVAWAAGFFSADDIAVNAGIGCYDRPSLHADATIFHAAADPVAKCAELWHEGVVDTRRGPASPHLVACTGDDKPVYVFPGAAGVCDRLGLVPLPSDYAARGAAHARAFRALSAMGELPPSPKVACLSPRSAADRARVRLALVNADVTVSIQGTQPCAHEYRAVGDHIAVITFPRAKGIAQKRGARIAIALRSLLEGLSADRCQAPDEFLRKVRRRLAAAGLGGVAVRMAGHGSCVSGSYGEGADNRWVEFFAE
jgi:hypothetical protein